MNPRKDITDLLNRLPSVGDLMEKPQIKGLVDRVNRTEVAQGVRQFVERMREEVGRRSPDMPIPSISELAERAARFILGRHATDEPQVINATGQLWLPDVLSPPPIAEEAIVAMTASTQYYFSATGDRNFTAAADSAGADSALVTVTPAASLFLAMAALAKDRPVVVARGELGTIDGGVRLTDLAEQAGVSLVEVGATNSVDLDDYERALAQGGGVLLRIESLPYAVRGHTSRPDVGELAKLASRHSTVLIHDIGRSPLAALPETIPLQVITASASLASGSAIVVARGDGFLGGPKCGLLVGHREPMDKVLSHSLSSLLAASSIVVSALKATITLHRAPDRAALNIPTLALLSTPLENLRTRAERLAAQIAEERGIAEATAREISAGIDLGGTQPLPSYGILVVCEPGERKRIVEQLDESRPKLVGTWESEERLLLDLRTVSPQDDIALVSAFNPPQAAEEVLED